MIERRSLLYRMRLLAPLILLAAIPVLAGAARLLSLVRGGPITPQNARFFAAPTPIALHTGSVIVFALLGALQVSWGIAGQAHTPHRSLGPWILCAGLLASLSGLWLTCFYPATAGDGPVLFVTRLLVGTLMTAELGAAGFYAWRRQWRRHGAWALRAYALGMGAGTQALVHLPWLLLVGPTTEASRAVLMALGWLINLVAAELWLHRRAQQRDRGAPLHTAEGAHAKV